MKKLIGLMVICLAFSFSAMAQRHDEGHGGERAQVGGGRQNIPAHGPARVHNARPAEEINISMIGKGIPRRLTFMLPASGLVTIRDAVTLTIALIIPSNMAASPVVSDEPIHGGLEVGIPAVSGSTVTTSRSLHTMSDTRTAGCGIRMTLLFMTIPTTSVGTSLTTSG